MIQRADQGGAGVRRAMEDPELGPQLRAVRVLTPEEAQKEALLKTIQGKINELGRIDAKMAEELTKALTDEDAFTRLRNTYLTAEEQLLQGFWGEEIGDFVTLEEAVLLGGFVINMYRPALRGYRITYLFQQKLVPALRRERLGTAMKLPGKMHHISGVDAVITLSFHRWRRLSDTDRQRLVHHELMHLEVVDGVLGLRGHDFEDFAEIVDTYGLRSESGEMNMDDDVGDALERAAAGQYDLLA